MTTHSCPYSDKAYNYMIITLIGFMASGKSSVGKKMSALLSCNYIDLDTYIEEKYARSIKDIFAKEGEEGFRKKEEESFETLFDTYIAEHQTENNGESKIKNNGKLTIIATGGGIVTNPNCRAYLKKTFCIFLQTGIETVIGRLEEKENCKDYHSTVSVTERPLLASQTGPQLYKRVCELMEMREGLYQECACKTVTTDGLTIDEVAAKCCQIISSLS